VPKVRKLRLARIVGDLPVIAHRRAGLLLGAEADCTGPAATRGVRRSSDRMREPSEPLTVDLSRQQEMAQPQIVCIPDFES
jgi:hypothetical protein